MSGNKTSKSKELNVEVLKNSNCMSQGRTIMPSRDIGIIIDTTATSPLIATSYGFAKYEYTPDFQLGDSVIFTPVYTPEGSVLATNLSIRPPILKSKIGKDGALLLEVNIQKKVKLAGNQRVFRTEFINMVQEGMLKGAEPNFCAQRRVWIKYITQKRAFEVVEVSELTSSKSEEVLGFAYDLNRQDAARIYVPGYPEDFVISRIPGVFEPRFAMDTWFKFWISAGKIDLRSPILTQTDLEFQHGGLIKIMCNKKGDKLETIHGDQIIDKEMELEARGIAGKDFVKKLWIKLDGSQNEKKPVLYLHGYQDQELPERIVRRVEKKREREERRVFPERRYNQSIHRQHQRRVQYTEQSQKNRPRQLSSRIPFLESSERIGNRANGIQGYYVNQEFSQCGPTYGQDQGSQSRGGPSNEYCEINRSFGTTSTHQVNQTIYEGYTTACVTRRKKSPEGPLSNNGPTNNTLSFKSFPPICLHKTTANDNEQLYHEFSIIMKNPVFAELIRKQFSELQTCFETGNQEKISLEVQKQIRTMKFYTILRQQFPEFLGKLKWILNF